MAHKKKTKYNSHERGNSLITQLLRSGCLASWNVLSRKGEKSCGWGKKEKFGTEIQKNGDSLLRDGEGNNEA